MNTSKINNEKESSIKPKYFANKVDDEMDTLWNEGKINLDVIEKWGEEHMRTLYKAIKVKK